jgi:hypothetical protein
MESSWRRLPRPSPRGARCSGAGPPSAALAQRGPPPPDSVGAPGRHTIGSGPRKWGAPSAAFPQSAVRGSTSLSNTWGTHRGACGHVEREVYAAARRSVDQISLVSPPPIRPACWARFATPWPLAPASGPPLTASLAQEGTAPHARLAPSCAAARRLCERRRRSLPAERVVGDSYSSRAMSWLQKSPDEPPQASQMPGIAPATSQVQQIMAAQEAELAFMTEFYNKCVAPTPRPGRPLTALVPIETTECAALWTFATRSASSRSSTTRR